MTGGLVIAWLRIWLAEDVEQRAAIERFEESLQIGTGGCAGGFPPLIRGPGAFAAFGCLTLVFGRSGHRS
jgi:hypothetical protein